MKRSFFITQALSLSLLLPFSQLQANILALSSSEVDRLTNGGNYVYVTPEIANSLQKLVTLLQPENCPAELGQLMLVLQEEKCFIQLELMQPALQQALTSITQDTIPLEEQALLKRNLEEYAFALQSGDAFVSIQETRRPGQNQCVVNARTGIFCNLLVKQNANFLGTLKTNQLNAHDVNIQGALTTNQLNALDVNIQGALKVDNLNGFLQATNGIASTAAAPTPTDFTGELNGDVTGTQHNTVVSQVCGVAACNLVNIVTSGTPLNIPNTLVLRDNTGSFSAQDIGVEGALNVSPAGIIDQGDLSVGGNATVTGNATINSDVIVDGNLNLTTNPSTTTAGNILKGGTLFIHNISDTTTLGVGLNALNPASTGIQNTAVGTAALASNTTTGGNTALGYNALNKNTIGGSNTAVGRITLEQNLDGDNNTAVGATALSKNTNGDNNTALGDSALFTNETGDDNTALGTRALERIKSGDNNIGIGLAAGINYEGAESNNIVIGNGGVIGESGFIRIGNPITHTAGTFIAGLQNAAGPQHVFYDPATGQLTYNP